MGNRWRLLGAVALVVLLAGTTCAETVPDPTQPPAGWTESKPDSGPEEAPEADTTPAEPLVLESVIDGLGRRMAIINGRRVSEGDLVRDYRIRRITASKVELVGEKGVRVLRLFSGSQGVKKGSHDPDG